MATDYDKVYRRSKHALGAPTAEFVQFFESCDKHPARVLDVGCGQGRDALFIGRLGLKVTGIDQSPAGISDMLEDAAKEGLQIQGEVADIRSYIPAGEFEVLVIDRTLHMLETADRATVLARLISHTVQDTVVLISDERSNIPAFRNVFDTSSIRWSVLLQDRGYLFVQRND